MTDRYRKRDFTPRPEKIESAEERGQALKNWLDVQEVPVSAFADAIGLSRVAFYRYLNGRSDLALVDQARAESIITAMGISDADAWEVLGIPAEQQGTFRTFRPPPLGHGAPISQPSRITRQLTLPMHGDAPAPAGATVIIDPAGHDREFQILELPDGRLHSVTPRMLASLKDEAGKHLGGLVSVNYG